MEYENFLQMLFYILPAIVVGIVTMYFLKTWQAEQNKQRYYEMRKENQKTALPIRLQAYERMSLFLERVALSNIVVRVKPFDENKDNYETLLIQTIEQEFEHNLAQQIYFSDDTWSIIKAAKNATMSVIRKSSMSDSITSSHKLREKILSDLVDKPQPTDAALAQLREDVRRFI